MLTKKLNPTLVELVDLLNTKQFYTVEIFETVLNTSAITIKKLIKKLQGYGVPINLVKDKGYRLEAPFILLNQNKIKKLLNDNIDIAVFETLPSTNNFDLVKNKHTLQLYLTEQQTHGKGRLNRSWFSPFGQNIYLSCFYSFQKKINQLAPLGLVSGLAVRKALTYFGIKRNLNVKWPNDLFYKNEKLAGILIDVRTAKSNMSHVLIGIGINVNMLDKEGLISQPWTSVRKILGAYIDRNILCAEVVNQLIHHLRRFDLEGFMPFKDEWAENDCLMRKQITLLCADKQFSGVVAGINDQGHLVLLLDSGKYMAFSSGDVTILK